MSRSSETLILGTRKGLFVLARRDGRWQIEHVTQEGVPISYATIDPRSGRLWACQDHGHWGPKLAYSTDRGRTWEEVPAPAYPEGSEVAEGKPAATKYLWVLTPGEPQRPERLYVGTVPGGLFVSDDGGRSFRLVESLWNHPSRPQWFGGGFGDAGIHSVVIDPRNPRRWLVGVSCAGVFETGDDGATWEVRNRGLVASFLPDPTVEIGHDPHVMVAAPTDPDVLWQQNHCGIFVSRNGGREWNDVSQAEGPARFGFAVAVDDQSADSAWVVPATSDEQRIAVGGALCVCRTDDGGAHWTRLGEGLPQRQAYDVVFRHALDAAGGRVAFGSTTGNVYLSEDRGDSWIALGQNFPPVYSVRFA